MLFDDNIFDVNLALFMPDIDINKNLRNDILSPMEGFLRGNMFKDEYVPYKNLSYLKLNPINEKEELLYNIMALDFAINDLSLYLDLNPQKKEEFNLFKKYVTEKEKLTKEYENLFGPLSLTHTTGSTYNWINSPWPWEKLGGSMYV